MPPARTGCPPYTLTPLLLDFESRPFFVDPPPFLCAASTEKGAGLATLPGCCSCSLCPQAKLPCELLSRLRPDRLDNIIDVQGTAHGQL